jgi:hypothetical protein
LGSREENVTLTFTPNEEGFSEYCWSRAAVGFQSDIFYDRGACHMSTQLRVQRNVLKELEFDLAEAEMFETGGITFPNGYCIELVKDEDGSLTFVDSMSKEFQESIDFDEREYVPPILAASLLEALTLPRKRGDCGSTPELFLQVCNIFFSYGLSEAAAQASTFFTFASWFSDVLPIAPCLVLIGGESEAGVLLQLLSCVVRHALPLAEINVATFDHLPMHVQPTMLIGHLRASTWGLLSASNRPHAYVLRKNGLTDRYCAKAAYAGLTSYKIEGDDILKVNCALCGAKRPAINDATLNKIASQFQPQLLDYRLKHAARVRDAEFDAKTLPTPLRTLARALGSCIVDAPELQVGVVRLLHSHGDELLENRLFDPNSVAVEALFALCHGENATTRVGVSEIAAKVSSIIAERGETIAVEPRSIGSRLRLLGFRPKRDSKGFAIHLTPDVRGLIHSLARIHEIEGLEPNVPGCSHCAGAVHSDREVQSAI